MPPTRRECLAAAATAAVLRSAPVDPAPWFDKPMRWAQLTLVEDDPGKYDLKFWLDYFRRTHSDAACLSAGGCVAFYPTKIPLHYQTPFLKGTDPFGDLVAGCRKLNMVVIARTDPHAVHQDVYDAHPDWIAVEADGKPRRHWASPDLWVTCALGPYNFDFMTEVTREIVTLYKVDGIFSNRWAGSGMCYCVHCRENFHQATGMDLPRTINPQDPARRAYMAWHQQRLFELWHLWDSEIRKINPGACYIPNSGGGAMADLNMKTIGETAPDSLRRPARRAASDRAVGQWEERQRVPLDDGNEAHRRHLQRRRGRDISLEGFGAERAGDPALGHRRRGQRTAPVVHEVRGRGAR